MMKIIIQGKEANIKRAANIARLNNAIKELIAAASPNTKEEDKLSSVECCICLNTLAPYQALFLAPCTHCFHYKCVHPLLGGGIMFLCPLCRQVANLEATVSTDNLFEMGEDLILKNSHKNLAKQKKENKGEGTPNSERKSSLVKMDNSVTENRRSSLSSIKEQDRKRSITENRRSSLSSIKEHDKEISITENRRASIASSKERDNRNSMADNRISISTIKVEGRNSMNYKEKNKRESSLEPPDEEYKSDSDGNYAIDEDEIKNDNKDKKLNVDTQVNGKSNYILSPLPDEDEGTSSNAKKKDQAPNNKRLSRRETFKNLITTTFRRKRSNSTFVPSANKEKSKAKHKNVKSTGNIENYNHSSQDIINNNPKLQIKNTEDDNGNIEYISDEDPVNVNPINIMNNTSKDNKLS